MVVEKFHSEPGKILNERDWALTEEHGFTSLVVQGFIVDVARWGSEKERKLNFILPLVPSTLRQLCKLV